MAFPYKDVIQNIDKEALKMKSSGDYYFLQREDVAEALKWYQNSLSIVTINNTVLRRELAEVIPICLATLHRYDEAFLAFQVGYKT